MKDTIFRIIKQPKGFIVERKVAEWTLLGLKYKWVPFVKSSGMDSCWHHSTFDFAKMNLVDEVLNHTEFNILKRK